MKAKIKSDNILWKKLYQTWGNMMYRCYNFNADSYENYRKRGIVVCDEWQEFLSFYNWAITHGYKKGLVLSRKSFDNHYSPETCEWITDQQHRAKRGESKEVLKTLYNGQIITLSELSNITGLRRETLKYRYLHGARGESLISEPHGTRYTYKSRAI
jgi:hypothetical protein